MTCLVIDGNEAWLAGPATTSDDPRIVAAFIHVRDGGPKGNGDRALLRLNNPGETLATFNGWCRTKFVPGGPYEVSTGEVQMRTLPADVGRRRLSASANAAANTSPAPTQPRRYS